jgi:hypothetical protein
MRKLKKFFKYNPLGLPPLVMFIFFIVIGVITDVPLLYGFGIFCMIVFIVSLVVTLKRYE